MPATVLAMSDEIRPSRTGIPSAGQPGHLVGLSVFFARLR